MRISLNTEENKIERFTGQYENIDSLLVWATENHCSDLFIKVGTKPFINRYGTIKELNTAPILQTQWEEWENNAINSEFHRGYTINKYYDFSYTVSGYRYRINVGYSMGKNILTARPINPDPPTFSNCGGKIDYPIECQNVLKECMSNGEGGMILFCAPTGNGKSTTMGACINSWKGENKPLQDTNIITLEDPIEYIYNNKESTRIVQKELGSDFESFDQGIISAMREHPQIILIGELRDKETIKAAISAGRSGHLLISSFHTKNPSSTITRLLDNFSDSLMDATDLISNMSLVVCQRLLKKKDGSGYDLTVQYLRFNHNLKALLSEAIKEGKNLELIIENYMSENSGNYDICGNI